MQGNPSLSLKDIKKLSENKIDPLIDPVLALLKVSNMQCLFCFGNNHLCYKDQTRKFSRPNFYRRHVNEVYFCYF